MKKIALIVGTALIMVSCGPSEAEVKQQIRDTAMQSVCDCFEKNQGNWLAYKKSVTQL